MNLKFFSQVYFIFCLLLISCLSWSSALSPFLDKKTSTNFFDFHISSTENTNSYEIPVGSSLAGKLTEKDFTDITQNFLALFSAQAYNEANVGINPDFNWQSAILMGGSRLDLDSKLFYIYLHGGLARMPGNNKLSSAFVLCHELGHLLGGEPKQIQVLHGEWASCEGQADDWSTRVCLKKWLTEQPALFANEQVAKDSIVRCKGQANEKLCQQMMSAGFIFFESSTKWMKETNLPSLLIEDQNIVETTDLNYPNTQCRVDTVAHAALGLPRPKCWFNH